MTMLSRSVLSAAISALIWTVISLATGGSALFSIGGGLGCGVVVFAIGYGFRRVFFAQRHQR